MANKRLKPVSEIEPGDLISIGGPIYEVYSVETDVSAAPVSTNEVWLRATLISVLPSQPTQVEFEADFTLPKNLVIEVLIS